MYECEHAHTSMYVCVVYALYSYTYVNVCVCVCVCARAMCINALSVSLFVCVLGRGVRLGAQGRVWLNVTLEVLKDTCTMSRPPERLELFSFSSRSTLPFSVRAPSVLRRHSSGAVSE